MIIHSKARCVSPMNALNVAMQPDMRLQQVIVLGMFLVIMFAIGNNL